MPFSLCGSLLLISFSLVSSLLGQFELVLTFSVLFHVICRVGDFPLFRADSVDKEVAAEGVF